MNTRTVLKAGLILCAVLFASLSTVRARQVWSEDQARSALDTARANATKSLHRASEVGLLSSEIAPLKSEKQRLDSRPAPSGDLFWGSHVSGFASRQRAAYQQLTQKVGARIEAVRVRTRGQASASLETLNKEIARGRSLDVDVTDAAKTSTAQAQGLSTATTPRAFRAVLAAATGAAAMLKSKDDAQQAYVQTVISQSGNTLLGVQTHVDGEVTVARGQLSLISLFSKQGDVLGAQLTKLSDAAHAQITTFAAAVKEAGVHSEVATIDAAFKKIVPSKVILVSTEDQWARMYENGTEVYNTPVTTGGPELPTDHGVFHIYMKASPFEFHSPWPPGSPYYYDPTPVQFWMPFYGGEGLHDASWRSNFGPGSNVAVTDLGNGNTILGTHGCVNLPYDAASFVWNWAPVGTAVVVV